MLNRKIKPVPSGKIQFSLPEINLFELANSVKVYHVKKSSLPIIQINLIIPAGSIHCEDNKIGISTLTAMLIDEGAGNLNGLEISDRIEMLGSILNISSNKEFTTISLLTLKENFKESLNIFSLIFTNPTFHQDDFDREKRKLESQILQLNDDPSYLASSELNRIIYKNTPYQFPSIGNNGMVRDITNDNIIDFYKRNYYPVGSSLIVVGDISENELKLQLNTSVGSWANDVLTKTKKYNVETTNKQLVLINKTDAAQSELRVGHISGMRSGEDFFARTILNSILGGQFSSRINLNLREDKGFTYGANSNYHYNQLGSTFAVSTSVKSENTTEALKEILFELDKVKTDITIEELNFSKSYLVRRYPSLFETYSQVATNLSLLPIFNLDDSYFTDYMKNISDVSLEDVQLAAQNKINISNLVIVVVGNSKFIGEDLSKFADSNNFEFINFNN